MTSPVRSIAIVGLLWAASVAAVDAQVVVLSARGPSASAYPQGAVVAANRVISLKAGDRLEVLDSAGSHVLVGPTSVTAAHVSAGTQVGLQDIFKRANASRPGIAAVRGFSLDEPKPPPAPEAGPLWHADLTAWQQDESGDAHDFCILKSQAPVLMRETPTADGTLVIYDEATQQSQTIAWPAGKRELTWPASLPVADGAAYDLNLDAMGAARVRWRVVDPGVNLTSLAASLLDKSCYDQLDALQTQLAAK